MKVNQEKEGLFLNPDEMAFRKIYWPEVQAGRITKVFRPGSRPCGLWRGYCAGQRVRARVIEKIGADWAKVAPVFTDSLYRDIVIEKVEVKKISELEEVDFFGASADMTSSRSLRYNLGLIYNLLPEELSEDSYITIISFNYEQQKGV
jgi:hypothetical protein